VNTVLAVTADDRVRARIGRCLTGFSVFDARDDGDALRMLRLVDIDIVLRESTGPAGALATFVTAAREAAPHSLIVAVGASGEDEASADFTVSDGLRRASWRRCCVTRWSGNGSCGRSRSCAARRPR
jgi:hypothetical protein